MVYQAIDKCSTEFMKSMFKFEKYKTDNTVFRLHYKISTWLILLYGLGGVYVLMHYPINCLGSNSVENGLFAEEIRRKTINDYCFVTGPFTVTNGDVEDSGDSIDDQSPYDHLGLVPLNSYDDSVTYHHYYKWMYFYTMLMIIIVHAPRQLWRFFEGGHMKVLASNLDWTHLIPNSKDNEMKEKLVNYLYLHKGFNKRYALSFVLCEILNVVAVVILLVIWNHISNGQLAANGWTSFEYFKVSAITRKDPIARAFPMMGKCIFKIYGPSGNIRSYDLLCILPVNALNMYAAILFWIHFCVLLGLGLLQLLVRLFLLTSMELRRWFLIASSPLTKTTNIDMIIENSSYSDWFILRQLSHNLEPLVYKDVLKELAVKFHEHGEA